MIPDDVINQILDRVDIVEVISGYIPLKRAGRNFKANCPFHHEKTPSFMVSPDKQIFRCFGCFPSGSLIKTERGFHRIEDIKVGQLVLTHRGRFMPVIRTLWRPYDGEIIKIYTRKSSLPVTLTSDHKVYVIKTKNCKYRSRDTRICHWRCKLNCPTKFFSEYKIETLRANQLSVNDYLLYPINQKIDDIKYIDLDKYYSRKESNLGCAIKSIPTKIKIDEKFLKLLGYWIAEGSNHRAYIRFSLGNHEREFANEIKEFIADIFHLKSSIHVRKNGKKKGIEISVCNSKLSNIFENLCGKRAENKHIPFELQNLSFANQRIILEAIFKGDGYTGKVHKCKTDRKFKAITTISLVLAEQLKDILLRLGISPTVTFKQKSIDKNNVRHKPAYTISWQEDIKLHFSEICKIDNVFYQHLPIREIAVEGFNGDVYNFTVAEDHSYATPNFVVGNCGEGGNVFGFVMKYERLEFPEAIELMAEKAGIQLPKWQAQSGQRSETTKIYSANEEASNFYHYILMKTDYAKDAYEYLKKRDVKEETIKKLKLGYAPPGWDSFYNHARKKGLDNKILERAGLVIPGKDTGFYDRFRHRVIFPIQNHKGQVVGFGARVLDETLPKYINSPETPVYSKGNNLYGMNLAIEHIKQKDFVIIVEGYLDFLTPHQAGVGNIVASLGTSLTTEQIRLLKRFTKNITMVFDSDPAGEAANLRGLDLLVSEGLNVKVAALPEGYDPDRFVREEGVEKFLKYINNAVDFFDYKYKVLKTRFTDGDAQAKAKIAGEMLQTIARIPNAILRGEYMKRLAENLEIDLAALLAEAKKIKTDQPAIAAETFTSSLSSSSLTSMRVAEKMLLGLALEEPRFIGEIKKHIKASSLGEENDFNILLEVLCETYNKNKTINIAKLINFIKDQTQCKAILDAYAVMQEVIDKDKCFKDCIKSLRQEQFKDRMKRLQSQIKTAQLTKDENSINKLLAEYNNLIRQTKLEAQPL